MSGTMDVVVAGGVQTMSSIPISSAMLAGQPLGSMIPSPAALAGRRYGDGLVTCSALQMIADKWSLSRDQMGFAQVPSQGACGQMAVISARNHSVNG